MTPYWQSADGRHVVYCGDSREVLADIESVDALATDPPYGVDFAGKNYTKQSVAYLSGDNNTIGPQVVELCLLKCPRAVVFPGNRMMFDYPRPREIGCVFCPSGAGNGLWGFTVHHPILFYGKALQHSVQSPCGFTSYDISDDFGHPCTKPTSWMQWAVRKCSMPDDLILDPFMGSGTTGVACEREGRRFIGIEIEKEYCDIAIRRIDDSMRTLWRRLKDEDIQTELPI